jgi:hypothetical protein
MTDCGLTGVVRPSSSSSLTSQYLYGRTAGRLAGIVESRRRRAAALIASTFLAVYWLLPAAVAQAIPTIQRGAEVKPEVHHDTSIPLRDMPPAQHHSGQLAPKLRPIPRPQPSAPVAEPLLQSSQSTRPNMQSLAPTALLDFDGVGNGFSGPQGSFVVQGAPPDTNGAAGPNHYVQIVNSDFAIFNKSGTVLYGPVAINTLWSGFGGGCATNNDGDPLVSYDILADRFIISQFSVSTTPFLECVAVSQTSDPTGAYYRYSFSYGNSDFPDYPKMGVWPDAYYMSYNIFGNGGNTFSGARVCAFDRSHMLTGAAATQQCFNTGTNFGGVLPADLTGLRQPPAGSPNYVVGLGASSNQLAYWKFHTDWTTPANSTFTGPTTLSTAAYSEACNGGTCIPQSGTAQTLDSLADRLMYRLSYRNLGGHEALVVNHSITAGSGGGVRWYELRPDASHNLSIFQQGTYAPDSNWRWMGSIAMDQSGDIALGFSVSGSGIHPQIHYTGRLPTDAAGVMSLGEGTIFDGAGSQSGSSLNRWGDYSAMSVDPSNDCTFWYTNEYIPSTGAFNWSTRIGSFEIPGCGAATNLTFTTPPPATLGVGVTPGTVKVSVEDAYGNVLLGSSASVTLTVTGPNSYSHTYTATASSGVATFNSLPAFSAPGAYTYTATDTPDSLTQAVATENVGQLAALTSPPPNSVLAGPTVTFTWSTAGGATGYSFRLGTTVGGNDVSASGFITATSTTPTNLPTNGETLHGRLFTYYGSSSVYVDYVFTAATTP